LCDFADHSPGRSETGFATRAELAWIISLILLIFYFLGLFVFHGTKAIHVLPVLAVIVLAGDYLLAKKPGSR
jgi:hypothetical protein